jgi:hypothetical protein
VRPLLKTLLQDMKDSLRDLRTTTDATLDYIRSHQWPTGNGPLGGKQLLTLLATVPGVGEATSLTWLAEVLDPRRFENAKQVAAFAGCDPSLKVSAGKVTSHVRRHGDQRLHQALLYAASGVLRRTGCPLGQWGRSIAGRHKTGGHRKACGAVARRIGCALWHVHRKAEPFTYEGYALAQKLLVPDTKLSAFLKPKAVSLLSENGIQTAQQLADAFNDGKLAAIRGLGEVSLKAIAEWVRQHCKRQRPPKSAASAPKNGKLSSATDYTLRPGLTFNQARAHKKPSRAAQKAHGANT